MGQVEGSTQAAKAGPIECRTVSGAALGLALLSDGIELQVVVFDGSLESVGQARRFVADALGERDCSEDAQVVASELATNALDHTSSSAPGGKFVVGVATCPGRVRVIVIDEGGTASRPHRVTELDAASWCSGRGLLIVASLADDLGWTPCVTGQMVWADFTTDAADGGTRR